VAVAVAVAVARVTPFFRCSGSGRAKKLAKAVLLGHRRPPFFPSISHPLRSNEAINLAWHVPR